MPETTLADRLRELQSVTETAIAVEWIGVTTHPKMNVSTVAALVDVALAARMEVDAAMMKTDRFAKTYGTAKADGERISPHEKYGMARTALTTSLDRLEAVLNGDSDAVS